MHKQCIMRLFCNFHTKDLQKKRLKKHKKQVLLPKKYPYILIYTRVAMPKMKVLCKNLQKVNNYKFIRKNMHKFSFKKSKKSEKKASKSVFLTF